MAYGLRSRSANGPPAAVQPPPRPDAASSPPESATVVGTASPNDGADLSAADAVAISSEGVQTRAGAARSSPSAAAAEPTQPPDADAGDGDGADAEVLKLVERVPKMATVLANVKKDEILLAILEDCKSFFPEGEGGRDIFYLEQLWEEVSCMMLDAIIKYTPHNEKDIDQKSKRYEAKKLSIVHKYVGAAAEGMFTRAGVGAGEKKMVAGVAIFLEMGHSFIRWYQKLIIPPGKTAPVSIPDQIKAVLVEFGEKDPGELFPRATAKHVYYIIGFLCNAGQKEAARRSKRKDVGKCIKALDAHFVEGKEKEAVAKIKEELPDGATDLVDKRCHFGGLKYPNKTLYTVFALIEKAYSTVATIYNFATFGGYLLGDICDGILENEDIRSLFWDLFQPDEFDDETIYEALRYYVKVFGNVRAKDLCYRYNSNIQKGATVGLRQRLAGGKGGKGGKKKATTKRQKTSDEKEESEDEPEVYEEEKATPEQQHKALQDVAAEEVRSDRPENRKICTIHQLADGHMEEDV
ncbi:hypothetical protein ACHAXT_007041 [Thalassiosira profunda]